MNVKPLDSESQQEFEWQAVQETVPPSFETIVLLLKCILFQYTSESDLLGNVSAFAPYPCKFTESVM